MIEASQKLDEAEDTFIHLSSYLILLCLCRLVPHSTISVSSYLILLYICVLILQKLDEAEERRASLDRQRDDIQQACQDKVQNLNSSVCVLLY